VLPFRYTLGFPVETLIGLNATHPLRELLRDLGVQWLYVAAMFAGTLAIWRKGLRRFVAFGG
jgi:ABC-2 type transport system permease protein